MQKSRLKIKQLTAAIGTCLALGVAAPMWANTDLVVNNDGLGLSAFVNSSSQVVLSLSIRIVGPDGFVIEKHVESDFYDWFPEGDLTDGLYTWEAWAVTAAPGAAIIEPAENARQEQSDLQSTQQAAETQEIPVERFFQSQDKQVETVSGIFRVENGVMVEVEGDHPLSTTQNTGIFQRIAGRVLDFLVPSAHAQDLTATSVAQPRVNFREDGTLVRQVIASADFWWVREPIGTGQRDPLVIQTGAPTASIWISPVGQVGMGTTSPSGARLHIRDNNNARIRLEDPSEASNWYVSNWNAGRFEVQENFSGVAPFAIQGGARDASLFISTNGRVGIGTASPSAGLHLVSADSGDGARMLFERTVGSNNWLVGPFATNRFMIGKNGSSASSNQVFQIYDTAERANLVLRNGNVGMGTATPESALHVRRTDGSAQILVEEASSGVETLFELANNGHSRFLFRDTSTSNLWEFRTAGADNFERFQINRLGSGELEMQVRKGGNMVIAGSLTEGSSREIKDNIIDVKADDILGKLSQLKVQEWSYKSNAEYRHLGPMAEDFYELFGLGMGSTSIAPRDLAGIALAAAQALQSENAILENRLAELEERINQIKAADSESIIN